MKEESRIKRVFGGADGGGSLEWCGCAFMVRITRNFALEDWKDFRADSSWGRRARIVLFEDVMTLWYSV